MRWEEAASLVLSPTTFSALVAAGLCLRLGLGPAPSAAAFLLMVVLPLAPVLLAAGSGYTDIFVSDRGARTPLLALAAASHLAGFALFRLLGVRELEFVFLSYSLVTAGMAAVNALHTKGSIHVAGAVGPGIALLMLGFWEGAALLASAPLVALVRVRLGAHSGHQILVGALVALLLTPAAGAVFWLA